MGEGWSRRGTGARADITYVIKRHCENFNSSNKSSAASDVTNSSKENTAGSSNCEAPKAKETETSKASHTILQKVRAGLVLPEGLGRGIRGARVVPSRLAITTEDFIIPT
jgi:hypothetical protein